MERSVEIDDKELCLKVMTSDSRGEAKARREEGRKEGCI
jgi:hypothetical protein